MFKNILLATIVTATMLFSINHAMSDGDLTSSGATTNDQVNSTGSNTAITGGYTSTASTTYQEGSSSSNSTTSTTNNNSFTGDTRTVPSASAPGISAMSQDLCTVGVSAGIQKPLLGMSVGITKRDMNCERMKLAKLLFDFNMKVSAVAILCQDHRVFQSMIMAGTPCPFYGKIGSEAEDEWNKYEQQRPDYEEYVAALRYMEEVDEKILEGLDDKESYILDSNGEPTNVLK